MYIIRSLRRTCSGTTPELVLVLGQEFHAQDAHDEQRLGEPGEQIRSSRILFGCV